ncbi:MULTISPECIES: SdpI family protein [Enterococcus]|uniref:SdpI family protein n=1 Tax=Enterococcus TaxID=1350 RepID=UPI00065DBF37|nr:MULTISPECIES: SdpI family protein [Enterococcus]KAF1299998.1 hypothetical protein BAU16_13315 [Enterococcus sp. JM9B]
MIFLVIGIFLLVIGGLFRIFPAKYDSLLYGYRSYYARMNQTNWQFAQKISGRHFLLFGGLMTAIGLLLKMTGYTNFFIIEMLLIPIPIVLAFGLTEDKLREFDKNNRGEENEYLDD